MYSSLILMACVTCLVVASGCAKTLGVQPCDILTVIPDAPPAVNRIIVSKAEPTARGLAINKGKVEKYKCSG